MTHVLISLGVLHIVMSKVLSGHVAGRERDSDVVEVCPDASKEVIYQSAAVCAPQLLGHQVGT